MDIGFAFSFPFKDPDWLKKFLFLGLISLIPILGAIVLMGYMAQVIQRSINNDAVLLPEIEFGNQLSTGFKLFLVALVYLLPAFVIQMLAYVPPMLLPQGNGNSDTFAMIVSAMMVCCVGILILYYILGYPYILLLGIITGISEFIPVVGPWIVYGALGILDILTGNYIRGVVVIVVVWLIDTVVDMYLRPRLAGEYTEVHPLVFLVGFIFGALTLGLPGLFIGPLIVGITYVIYHVYRD